MTEPFHWNSMVQWPDSEAVSEFSSTPFPQVLTQLQEDHDSHPKFPSMPFSQNLSPPLNEDYNMFLKPTLMPFSQVLTSPYEEDYSSHSQPALMPFSQVLTLPTNEQEDPMLASTCTEVSTIFCLSARYWIPCFDSKLPLEHEKL
ncbi:uncharacterized protein C8R40DRAFT_916974 [Lentinula edodes]|uniref:uncharacterized protein n=1 Tax=Lentinula edodes TaxID=5353 RepID=UPI001E8D1250|nr:uncharacterized protein C8R40DRAFT_916974 [Lentinula edodes]KAH7867732.1 hypothetical protein C8R40DRAFT_916974 [Lentinula edodes]